MSRKLKRKGVLEGVWLAGLGALAISEQEGNDLFQQLVKTGRDFVSAEGGQASGELADIIDLVGRLEVMGKETKVSTLEKA